MPKCFFVVRASVADPAERAAFDAWYRDEHLPQAMAAFGAEKGWRFWSRSDPSVHYALYQFGDIATLRSRLESPGFKELVADFDQAWPQVPRTRDIIEAVQEV